MSCTRGWNGWIESLAQWLQTLLLTPLQAAFRKHHALQCGFCTPGFITTAHALLTNEPDADEERIRDVLSGNLCRCTGYVPIVEAVLEARAHYGHKATS